MGWQGSVCVGLLWIQMLHYFKIHLVGAVESRLRGRWLCMWYRLWQYRFVSTSWRLPSRLRFQPVQGYSYKRMVEQFERFLPLRGIPKLRRLRLRRTCVLASDRIFGLLAFRWLLLSERFGHRSICWWRGPGCLDRGARPAMDPNACRWCPGWVLLFPCCSKFSASRYSNSACGRCSKLWTLSQVRCRTGRRVSLPRWHRRECFCQRQRCNMWIPYKND